MANARDEYYMKEALKEAEKARDMGEVPVGCIVVWRDRIIARAHNQSIEKCDPSAHAEILALRKATRKLNNYRIPRSKVFVTVKPCKMCEGALAWARVKNVTYGSEREGEKVNHKYSIKSGLFKDDCSQIIKDFFYKRRKRNTSKKNL